MQVILLLTQRRRGKKGDDREGGENSVSEGNRMKGEGRKVRMEGE